MKILVAEDDEMILAMLQSVLESKGHDVLTASDGGKAMAMLANHDVDLMITDIIMPFKEGVETIIECRRRWENLKILAISGGGRAAIGDFLEMAKKFGADGILKKPFRPEELHAAIEKIMQ